MTIARGAVAVCLVFLASALLAGPGRAAERFALVIGNGAYAQVEALPNAARDAVAVGEALEALGYTVFTGLDVSGAAFERLVDEFDEAAAGAEAVVFYYAGHGFGIGGRHHLAPVDAVLRDRARINTETLVLKDVIARIRRGRRQTIVLVDACRNDPLPPGTGDGAGQELAAVGSGDDTFVAFATQPGAVSYGGAGNSSPFTEALLARIGKPNLPVSSLMAAVRKDVSERTGGRQVPWNKSSLRGDFSFNPAPVTP